MDAVIVKALCDKTRYSNLLPYVPKDMLAPDTSALLSWVGLYWKTYPEHDEVDFAAFNSMVSLRATQSTPEELATMKALTHEVQAVDDSSVDGVVTMMHELAYSGRAASILTKYQAGEEIDLMYEMKKLQREFGDNVKTQNELFSWEDRGLDDVLAANEEGAGLKLRRFGQLRHNIRALRGGDTVAVAAPVDAGKTSLLAAIAADFANQMKCAPERYGDRPILWLVNESMAVRTVPRIYQAATGKTLAEIRELHREGQFEPLYLAEVGDWHRIRVKDAHSITMPQIATLVEEMNPAVVIIDMVANIRGGTAETEHQNLEAKWQELRSLACEHDFLMVGTMQFSAEGYDMLYPPLTALKQSKIGVQGALDVALFMGKLNNDTEGLRGLSTPKNKCPVSGKPSVNQFEVIFDTQRCQFNCGFAESAMEA
uniref:DNA helicase n=2 Tax=Caudoviricetes TaxID=2731619 RepID=A0AAU7L210_9CAUD